MLTRRPWRTAKGARRALMGVPRTPQHRRRHPKVRATEIRSLSRLTRARAIPLVVQMVVSSTWATRDSHSVRAITRSSRGHVDMSQLGGNLGGGCRCNLPCHPTGAFGLLHPHSRSVWTRISTARGTNLDSLCVVHVRVRSRAGAGAVGTSPQDAASASTPGTPRTTLTGASSHAKRIRSGWVAGRRVRSHRHRVLPRRHAVAECSPAYPYN